MDQELLTENEKSAMKLTGVLWGLLQNIVGDGPSRDGDLRGLIEPIHEIQRAILSQAAGRAYPDEYRLLGGLIEGAKTCPDGASTIEEFIS